MAYKPGTAIQDFTTTLGPASYLTAAKPTVALPRLKRIRSVQDVKIKADGYLVDIVSFSRNTVTYRVRYPAPAHTHVFTGAALATHAHTEGTLAFTGAALATHQHDITTVVAAGGGGALTDPLVPGPIESAGGGQVNLNAVDAITAGTPAGTIAGSVAAITAGTPAGTNANQAVAVASEVPDTTVLNAVTFRVSAVGFPSNVRAQYA